MRGSMGAVVVAACLFGVVSAQDSQEAAPASEKKICRSIAATGSFLPKRMCLTKAE